MKIELGKVYTGWYFPLGRNEVFVISNRIKKTDSFLSMILKKLEFPDNPDVRSELKYYLLPANLEMKFCPANPDLNTQDKYYYNIFGKNFSGYGSDDISDGRTVIIEI